MFLRKPGKSPVENDNKKLNGWSKVHTWLIDKLSDTEGALIPMDREGMKRRAAPELDYQVFLEGASKSMIRFKKPERLIRMIVRVIDEQVKVAHTAVLLYKEEKNAFILIDSKGEEGVKIPVGFIRMTFENPLIKIFNERKNYLISETGTLVYEELMSLLANKDLLEKEKELGNELELAVKQMDLLRADVCIPCYYKKDLAGILVLGRKLNDQKFMRQEIGFFMTLANDAAMAISNAQLIQNMQQKVEEIKGLYDREHRIFIHTAIALATAIDARDPYTHGHTARVTRYCLTVAEELEGIPEAISYKNFKETLHIASLLHDVGKIAIPDDILRKKAKLTKKEIERVREHPAIGAAILTPIKELGDVVKEIKYHQEWYNGKGYPEGLKSGQIPLIARIISVCDAFDAITTDRPYRGKQNHEAAIREIQKHSGTQFDPIVVSAFLLAYEKGKIINNRNKKNPLLYGR